MLQEKPPKLLSGQYSNKEDSNQLKLYLPTHGEFENLCFISAAPMVCMSRAFVYKVVDLNKSIAISSTKPPSYAYAQVTARLKLHLG